MSMSFEMNGNRGSVLMEFIIVLPIYMLLLGFAFVIGDLSLETIHLAGAADRVCALAPDDTSKDADYAPFKKYKVAASPDKDEGNWDRDLEPDFSYQDDPDAGDARAKVSDYKINHGEDSYPRTYVADAEISGPWVEMSAAQVTDDYTLPPWVRGLVAYWYREEYDTTDGVTKLDGILKEMLESGDLGRTEAKGKDLDRLPEGSSSKPRRFGYYTLRRHGSGQARLTYRTWGDGKLVLNDDWKKVADEKFPNDGASDERASGYEGIDGGSRKPNAGPPSWDGDPVNTESRHYHDRDDDLKAWSNRS